MEAVEADIIATMEKRAAAGSLEIKEDRGNGEANNSNSSNSNHNNKHSSSLRLAFQELTNKDKAVLASYLVSRMEVQQLQRATTHLQLERYLGLEVLQEQRIT